MTTRNRNYMPHIDGLRCLAVMAVLLFHFGVPGLGGGYVGVDVFLVISGYLITSIIVGEVSASGAFDFRNFYARRIRRILPALLATLAATTVAAVASLTPAELAAYGKSLAASAVSVSNLLFWSESGYFDSASQTKPLLHTWSLSVEEQFYLFWPAFILLAYRMFGKRALVWCIAAAGAASFVANHLAVTAGHIGYKSDLFFLLHFRVFEFVIGGVGCFLINRLPRARLLHELGMALGLGLILASVFTLEEGDDFPYLNAIVPCLGAFLIIASHQARSVGALFTNRVSVWLGTISYSLYLTHWPVVVFVEQYMPRTAWGAKFAVMAGLSLVTAIALHYLVEVRYRYRRDTVGRPNFIRRILWSSVACCALGLALFASNGMAWRYTYFTPGASGQRVAAAVVEEGMPAFKPLDSAQIEAGKAQRFADLADACTIQTLNDASRCLMSRPVQVLLFGNSHEPDAFNVFHYLYGEDSRVNLINFGTVNDCEVAFGEGSFSSPTVQLGCDKRFSMLQSDEFLANVDVLVYNTHQGFDYVARDLWTMMAIIKKKKPSISIIAIGSYLQTSAECASLYNRHRTYAACRDAEFVNYYNPDEKVKSAVPQAATLDYLYISKYELLCGEAGMTACKVYANGEPAFYDQHHLSRGFAHYLGSKMAKVHAADLAKAGLPAPIARQ